MIEVSGRASPQTGTTALSRPWLGTQGLPAKAPSSPPSPWNLRQAPPRRLVDGHGDGKTDPHDYSSEPFHRRICWDAPQLDQVPPTHNPQWINKQTKFRNATLLKTPSETTRLFLWEVPPESQRLHRADKVASLPWVQEGTKTQKQLLYKPKDLHPLHIFKIDIM